MNKKEKKPQKTDGYIENTSVKHICILTFTSNDNLNFQILLLELDICRFQEKRNMEEAYYKSRVSRTLLWEG